MTSDQRNMVFMLFVFLRYKASTNWEREGWGEGNKRMATTKK